MKKIVLYTAIVSFSLPLSAYAMGLGNIKVNSYLNQPFNAEIELIDVGKTPLSGIKANLASPEDFEKIGLEHVHALNLLTFSVEKNIKGTPIVKVRSIERISEPYMQLLVDLAWADGQGYRAYTVLLDPPNYKLVLVKKQLRNIVRQQYESQSSPEQTGVVSKPVYSSEVEHASATGVDNRGEVTYGPTVANETIWQIAQRYKTENILLQQIILAIVGTNPEAFTEGNLNGLKVSSRLRIPANSTVIEVPVALAKLEVLAHDKAWQSRVAIEHALLPPYINSTAPLSNDQEISPLGYPLSLSIIPGMSESYKPQSEEGSVSSRLLPLASSLLFLGDDDKQQAQNKIVDTQQEKIKAEMDIAAAAINSVREAHTLLIDQLRSLQTDNRRLKQQLAQRDKDLVQLRKQMHNIMQQQGVAKPVLPLVEESNLWPWALLLIGLGAGSGVAYWWFWTRAGKKAEPSVSNVPSLDSDANVSTETVAPVLLPTDDQQNPSEIVELEEKLEDTPADEHIELEPELSLDIEETPGIEETVAEPIVPEITPETNLTEEIGQEEQEEQDHSIDFVLTPVEPPPSESAPAPAKPVKSKAALETLLALAKTYIGMDDVETAEQSLKEVLKFGSKDQQEEAQRLLDQLNNHK